VVRELTTVVRMALDGIGIAVIPSAILHNVPAGGKLRPLATNAKLPDLNFVVSWPATEGGGDRSRGWRSRRAAGAGRDKLCFSNPIENCDLT